MARASDDEGNIQLGDITFCRQFKSDMHHVSSSAETGSRKCLFRTKHCGRRAVTRDGAAQVRLAPTRAKNTFHGTLIYTCTLTKPCFTRTLVSHGHPLCVTHDGICNVSSLLNAAPCHTGAAYPRRTTAARVLRHRARYDPLRPATAGPTWFGVHQNSQALTTAQDSGTAMQTNRY